MTVYAIKNWARDYEHKDSRRCKIMHWVSVPTKQTGTGFRRIAAHPRSAEVYAAWNLMLGVAARMPCRGLLANTAGPLDADDLAFMTGFPQSIFEVAFEVLSGPKIGWLERLDWSAVPEKYRDLPERSGMYWDYSGKLRST